ncbi:hypothetical protein GCM10023328_22240 [Modestobacter marinus]|uniref:Uncharacterized protein n=1 Tax=Modestobacter marinus TaxID=477641 RepID=A0A846LUM5_9ACTN|nr:hypothetical protein [Modestobacter marinus]NIH70104.1 hypothetical protein [Modestobacter marinus]GGL83998.1 hypothetical protein GCM10011589_45560 [Modestobacter marinus]
MTTTPPPEKNDRLAPPPDKSTGREVVEGVVEAAASVVPLVGGPVGVALAMTMGWAYNKRMQAWLQDVAEAITELQDTIEGWPPFQDLAEDEVFVDAVVHASRAAQATHQDEKLNALRNGVLNSLGPDAPDVDEQARFFRLVDQLTPSHLRLLTFLDDPGAFFDAAGVARPNLLMGGRSSLLSQLPDFAGRPDGWVDLLTRDLSDAALTNMGGLNTISTGDSLWRSATSPLGGRFLRFISTPEALQTPS